MKIYKCTKRMEAPTKSLFDFFFLFLLFFENTWYTKQGTWFQAHVNKINFLGWKRSINIGKWCTAETRIRVKNLSWRNGMLFSVVRQKKASHFGAFFTCKTFAFLPKYFHFHPRNWLIFSVLLVVSRIWLCVEITRKMCWMVFN